MILRRKTARGLWSAVPGLSTFGRESLCFLLPTPHHTGTAKLGWKRFSGVSNPFTLVTPACRMRQAQGQLGWSLGRPSLPLLAPLPLALAWAGPGQSLQPGSAPRGRGVRESQLTLVSRPSGSHAPPWPTASPALSTPVRNESAASWSPPPGACGDQERPEDQDPPASWAPWSCPRR